MQGSLEHCRAELNGVGWFIPPYITMGFLDFVCAGIRDKGGLSHKMTWKRRWLMCIPQKT